MTLIKVTLIYLCLPPLHLPFSDIGPVYSRDTFVWDKIGQTMFSLSDQAFCSLFVPLTPDSLNLQGKSKKVRVIRGWNSC